MAARPLASSGNRFVPEPLETKMHFLQNNTKIFMKKQPLSLLDNKFVIIQFKSKNRLTDKKTLIIFDCLTAHHIFQAWQHGFPTTLHQNRRGHHVVA
jgi:hypothetical protein